MPVKPFRKRSVRIGALGRDAQSFLRETIATAGQTAPSGWSQVNFQFNIPKRSIATALCRPASKTSGRCIAMAFAKPLKTARSS